MPATVSRVNTPPLRCSANEHLTVAGLPFRPAYWRAPGNTSAPWVSVCDRHKRPLDVAVGADEPVLVVTIDVRVRLAARCPDVAHALAEAVAALQRQLAAIGGQLELAAVTSDVVQPAAQAGQGSTKGPAGDPT